LKAFALLHNDTYHISIAPLHEIIGYIDLTLGELDKANNHFSAAQDIYRHQLKFLEDEGHKEQDIEDALAASIVRIQNGLAAVELLKNKDNGNLVNSIDLEIINIISQYMKKYDKLNIISTSTAAVQGDMTTVQVTGTYYVDSEGSGTDKINDGLNSYSECVLSRNSSSVPFSHSTHAVSSEEKKQIESVPEDDTLNGFSQILEDSPPIPPGRLLQSGVKRYRKISGTAQRSPAGQSRCLDVGTQLDHEMIRDTPSEAHNQLTSLQSQSQSRRTSTDIIDRSIPWNSRRSPLVGPSRESEIVILVAFLVIDRPSEVTEIPTAEIVTRDKYTFTLTIAWRKVLLTVLTSVVVIGISLVAGFSLKRASEGAQQDQKSSRDCTDVNSRFLGRFADECQVPEKPMLLAASPNEWLDAHNTRRKYWHEKYNETYIPLVWSVSLAEESKSWARKMLNHWGCYAWNENNDHSGQTISSYWNRLYQVESPDEVLGWWVDDQKALDYPDNKKFTQTLWRASKVCLLVCIEH
jgi:hypothetical protein